MTDIVERLLLNENEPLLCREAADEIERLRDLIEVLIYNDPNARMPDKETVLDVWRKEARTVLNIQQPTGKCDAQ